MPSGSRRRAHARQDDDVACRDAQLRRRRRAPRSSPRSPAAGSPAHAAAPAPSTLEPPRLCPNLCDGPAKREPLPAASTTTTGRDVIGLPCPSARVKTCRCANARLRRLQLGWKAWRPREPVGPSLKATSLQSPFIYSSDDDPGRSAQELRARRARRIGERWPTRGCSSSAGSTQAIAAQLPEPNAMTLGDRRRRRPAVDARGADQGLRCARHRLVHQLRKPQGPRAGASIPYAALQFHWVELERVVRIEGKVEKVEAAESDAYFATRPLDSRTRRLGLAAEPGHRLARRARRQRGEVRRAVPAGAAAPAALGRLSARAPMRGSSGRGASRACTTACAIAPTVPAAGCASASRPES